MRSTPALAISLAAAATGLTAPPPASAEPGSPIEARAAALESRVIGWRRDIHQNPELSNQEFRTGALVADHLEALGLEVRRNVAHTGVVGVLRGPAEGPVVALRADMDALPVTEDTGLPFASTVRSSYRGRDVGVMHACGHDAHTAILMGVAELLSGMQGELPGSVVFVFQPAEEGAPDGEEGGADLMLAEGAFDDPEPDVVFGLHVTHRAAAGEIGYAVGGAMASSDRLRIVIHGSQTHAAYPWQGVDPIAVAARLIPALHAIPAREVDTRIGSVVSIGAIHGGVRNNIIPSEVELLGTIRALHPDVRTQLHERVRHTIDGIVSSAGAEAEVEIRDGYPITFNDPALTRAMVPTLERVAGKENVSVSLPATGAEDFSYYQERVPGLFYWLGVRDPGKALEEVSPNHSPGFMVDESALPLGLRSLTQLTLDYMEAHSESPAR